MDEKTLEYMGERVDAARQIVKDRKAAWAQLERLQRPEVRVDGVSIGLMGSSGALYLPKATYADIHEALIQILKNEITSLDEQLAEL